VIGQFGHCNQDMLNLLLTGQATSNVIDGELQLGDSGLRIRGVARRNPVGYLTHLEALRYCQVTVGVPYGVLCVLYVLCVPYSAYCT
jgi:ubiquitin carboxyl-terminal hydrolase MINDY-3/4